MLGFIWLYICAIAVCAEYGRREKQRIHLRDLAKALGEPYYETPFGMYYGDKKVYRRIVEGHEVLVSYWNKYHVYYDLTAEREIKRITIEVRLEAKEAEARAAARAQGQRYCSLTKYADSTGIYMDTESGEFFTIGKNYNTSSNRFLPYVRYTFERVWKDQDASYRWKCVDSYPITDNERREMRWVSDDMYKLGIWNIPTHIGKMSVNPCYVAGKALLQDETGR